MGILWTDEWKKKRNHIHWLARKAQETGWVSRMYAERIAHGWTLADVASRLDVRISHSTIRMIEKWNQGTTVEREHAISKLFGMSFDDLMRPVSMGYKIISLDR